MMNLNDEDEKSIIILTDEFPPSKAGGIASWAYALSQSLSKRGFTVHVLTKRDRSLEYPVAYGGPIEVVHVWGRDWSKFRWLYVMVRSIPLLLGRPRPVVIASTWLHVKGLVILKRLLDFKIICFAHGTDVFEALASKQKKGFRKTIESVDVFVPVSRFIGNAVRKAFPNLSVQSTVIHNGIDTARFAPKVNKGEIRRKFKIDLNAQVLLTVGRTIKLKGHRHVLRALAEVVKYQPSTLYLIAGTGQDPEYTKIRNLVRDLNLGAHVRFLPYIPNDALPDLYAACDIFVLTAQPVFEPFYQEEALSMVLLEASSCGIPVIGTWSGGIPEVIEDGKTGFLVSPNDLPALVDRIVLLFKNPALRKKIGEKGRERVCEDFSIEKTTDKVLTLMLHLERSR
jgi:glycosyltransferase involved in cell wall biosynthesis